MPSTAYLLIGAFIAPVILTGAKCAVCRYRKWLTRRDALISVGLVASGVGHDLNNVLTCISGHAELLEAGAADSSPQRTARQIRELSQCATRINQQMTGLVSGHRQIEPCNDVMAQLLESGQMLRTTLGDQLAISLDLPADRIDVTLSRSQIDQILLNLVFNARDAGAKHVVISAQLEAARQRTGRRPGATLLLLQVSDDGTGMTWATRMLATHAFFTRGKSNGTGLGLATVKRIAGRTGGSLSLQSIRGQGTSVTVTLPCHRPAIDNVRRLQPRSNPTKGPSGSPSPGPQRLAC
ncbi:MAG: ATP-binding protein [Pseudomonadota bacterium]